MSNKIDWTSFERFGGLGKGKTRKQVKAVKHKDEKAVKIATHEEVWQLDPKCICGDCPPRDDDEMHEVRSRAKTRGLPPEQRFNTANCVRLSRTCHHDTTGIVGGGKKLRIEVTNDLLGANGLVMLRWKDGRIKTYQREATMKTVAKPVTTTRITRPGGGTVRTGSGPVTK